MDPSIWTTVENAVYACSTVVSLTSAYFAGPPLKRLFMRQAMGLSLLPGVG